jgi:hypothetical protein
MVESLANYTESVSCLIAIEEPSLLLDQPFDESLFYHFLQNVLRFEAAGVALVGRRAALQLWQKMCSAMQRYLAAVAHLLDVERALVNEPSSRSESVRL